jgi:hypothetical protein
MASSGLGSDVSKRSFDRSKHLEASRHIFSSQCKQNRHPSHHRDDANLFFSKDIQPTASALQRSKASQGQRPSPVVRRPSSKNGGAERDRTADPLLAKKVLSQLSYSPNLLGTACNRHAPHRGVSKSPFINTIPHDQPGLRPNPQHRHPQNEWWARVDSNYRPHAYQACALTD